jgi:hypothetical protein
MLLLVMPSQAAKTYLPKHYETFPGAAVEDMVQHQMLRIFGTFKHQRMLLPTHFHNLAGCQDLPREALRDVPGCCCMHQMLRLSGMRTLNACCFLPLLQAAKTYLEKHYETFPGAAVDDMVQHGLRALAATLSEGELTKANCSVAIVGKNAPYVVLEDDDVEPYLQVGVMSQVFSYRFI